MPTFDTPEPIFATITLGAGNVRIIASDRTDTVVDVRPRNRSDNRDVTAAQETRVEYANGRLLVTGPESITGWMFWRVASIEVTVELPADSSVDAEATYGDLHSEGRLGDSTFTTSYGAIRLGTTGKLRLRTAHGDVSVTRVAGRAEVTTTNGNIRIREIDGPAVVKNTNGDIKLGEVAGDLRLNTSSGEITVDRALANVGAKTAYGGITLGEVSRGLVELETAYGALAVGIREGTAAWLDVSSHHGNVHTSLNASDQPEETDQTVEVFAHTAYGDISIHHS